MTLPPQIVSSQQCLDCRGCCLFPPAQGDWAPRLMPEDVDALTPCAGVAWLQGHDRLSLEPCGHGMRACSLLDRTDHRCRVYAQRPWECRLYPFLLSREHSGFKVYAHLGCPAVVAARGHSSWLRNLEMVRSFFSQPGVQSFIEHGAANYPDYSLAPAEIEEVFAFEPAQALWDMRPEVERVLALRPQPLSARAFVNMLAWKDFFTFRCREADGHVCIFADQPAGTFMYWPPLANGISSAAIEECFRHMHLVNRGGSLTRVEHVSEEELSFFNPGQYSFELRGKEYVYARADIAALAGQAYKSRRGDVNAFRKRQAHVFRPYEPRDFNACAILFDCWAQACARQHPDELFQHMLVESRLAHRLVLSYAARLGLVGRVVEVDGRIVGYTFGYALGKDMFCVLLEVADVALRGLPAFIFSRFCADDAVSEYTWINAMDDSFSGNLAWTKMSWRPARVVPVYAVVARR